MMKNAIKTLTKYVNIVKRYSFMDRSN